jgi:hypothetical protein
VVSSLGAIGDNGVRFAFLRRRGIGADAEGWATGSTTAGTIFGEEITSELLLGRGVEYLERSDDDDDRFFGCLTFDSTALDASSRRGVVGELPSLPLGSRLRRERCSSRMNPRKMFRRAHFPMFTAKTRESHEVPKRRDHIRLVSSLNRSCENPTSSA